MRTEAIVKFKDGEVMKIRRICSASFIQLIRGRSAGILEYELIEHEEWEDKIWKKIKAWFKP